MSEPFPATPEPLRRRRSRDRALGGTGEDDSWAQLVGLSRPWDTDSGQGEALPPPPVAAGVDSPPASPSDRARATDDPPLSRRAARRREAEVEPAADHGPPPARGAVEEPVPLSSGGLPLRPWWASAGPSIGDLPPAREPVVPAAFLRPEPRAVPSLAPEPPAQTLPPSAVPQLAPAPPPSSLPELAPAPTFVPREQPQVNPWPGEVRPALPPTGPSGFGRGPAQRTSDVAAPGAVPEGVARRPPAVVLPVDHVQAAGPAPAPIMGPITGPATGPNTGLATGPTTGPLPLAVHPTGHPAPLGVAAFGNAPVLPAPELPGPVLPGVERFTEPSLTADEQAGDISEHAAAPPGRRRARTASSSPEPATATGTIYLPTTSAAGAAPETDLRVVPGVPPPPTSPISGNGPAAPPAEPTPAPPPASSVARRRRLSAAPTRFPALDAAGEVEDADPFADVTRTRPTRPAAGPPADRTSTTSMIVGARRGRRTPARTAAATPAGGSTGPPSMSGPAAGLLGGGTSLLGAAGELPGAGSSTAGSAAAAAAASTAGAVAAGGGLTGAAATGGLDVIAGIGQAGRSGPRRPDAGGPRGGSAPRTPPLRAVRDDADDDHTMWRITPVQSPVTASSGQEETPSPRRRSTKSETPLSRAAADDEAATSPDAQLDEPAVPRPVWPLDAGGVIPGGPTDGGAGKRRDTPTRRSTRTGQAAETAVTLAAVPAPPTSKAGRNLPAAIAVGLGLGGAVIASLLFRKEAFVLVIAAAILVALWELTGALRSKRIEVPLVPLGVGALGMLVSAFVAGEDGLLVSFALTAFGVLLWRIIDGHDGATRDVAAAVFVAAYVPFLAGFAMLMLAMPDGALRVLTFIAVTVSNDIGGYATGVLAGRHPMAPTISPKKSWEGMVGSVALCMAVGAGTVHYLLHGSVTTGLALGAAAAVTATIGDLSESLIKRDLGIKDMGHLLPGHGGIMDRLDSLLPTAPAAYLLLLVLVPVH